MLNIFKLGKYVVAWSLPLAQTSNTKTHLHKRSRRTIQEHLKKQPANVLMFKDLPLLYMKFQTTVDKKRILDSGRCVQYIRILFFFCVKSYSLYCSRIICIYICNLFNDNQVPRNSIHPHQSNNELERNRTRTWERIELLLENNVMARAARQS